MEKMDKNKVHRYSVDEKGNIKDEGMQEVNIQEQKKEDSQDARIENLRKDNPNSGFESAGNPV